MHILSHYIAARVLTWRPASTHDRLRRWIHMLLESILAGLLDLQHKLLPIVGEVYNVIIGKDKMISYSITLYSCSRTYLATFECTGSFSLSYTDALGISY